MSLIFQIHPLTIEYERKKAYHSITVGLFIAPEIIEGEIVTTTPAGWPKNDQETLWHELFQEVVKLTDHFIPKAESQTSATRLRFFYFRPRRARVKPQRNARWSRLLLQILPFENHSE